MLLDALTTRHRDGADTITLADQLRALLERYGRYWRKDVEPDTLLDEVVALLTAMAVVTVDPDGRVRPRPVAARFAPDVAEPEADDDGGQQSLL